MNRMSIALAILVSLTLQGCGVKFMRKPAKGEVALVAAPSGKALVNFHRPSNFGGAMDYQIFDRKKLIGNTKGRNRFQYACDPGEHVFIGTAQRGSAIKADLVAGKVYDVVINVGMGFFRANITMEPITKNHGKRSEVPIWESRERLWIFADDRGCKAFENHRRRWAENTLNDFLEGSHKGRIQTLGRDDHR